MTELLLNIALINFRAAGKACARGMAREQPQPLGLGQVGAQDLISRARCLSERRSTPVERAAQVLEAMLTDAPAPRRRP